MTRILAVGLLPPPIGGLEVLFAETVTHLARYHDTHVVDLQVQANVGESGLFSLIKVARMLRILAARVLPILFHARYDVLYFCPTGPSRLGLFKDIVVLALLRPKARRMVLHFHSTGGAAYARSRRGLLRRLGLAAYGRPDVAIRLAVNLEPDDATIVDARRVLTVPVGIPDPMILWGCAWQPPVKTVRLAFMGALTEDKGIFVLVDTLKLLVERGHDAELVLIGEGTEDEVASLRRRIVGYGLDDRVTFTGVLTGRIKFETLAGATLFCFPSFFRAETQPVAMVEAIALGLPVVATRWRAIPTIVAHGINGLLVPPHRADETADAVEDLLSTADLREFGRRSRQHFVDCFRQERFLAGVEDALIE